MFRKTLFNFRVDMLTLVFVCLSVTGKLLHVFSIALHDIFNKFNKKRYNA